MEYLTDEARRARKRAKKRAIILTVVCSFVSLILGVSVTAAILKKDDSRTVKDPNLAKFQEIYGVIKDEWYFGDVAEDDAKMINRALDAMVNGQDTDAYLTYYEPDESDDKKVCGLGVVAAGYDGYLIVDRVYSGSSAAKAGLIAGDIITSVNGEEIRYRSLNEVSGLIQGPCGSRLDLTIKRDGREKNITTERRVFNENTVVAYDHGNYGILQITGFGDDTATSADRALADFVEDDGEKVVDLIIDLRDNGGGYIMAFSSLADLFTAKGAKFGRYEYKNPQDSYDVYASSGKKYDFKRIYILISGDTASAAESFSCAMRDNLDNVTLIGTQSYGKGIAQRKVSFSDGSSLRYTYAEFFRADGRKLHKVGVAPDIKLPLEGPQEIFDAPYLENETFEERLTKYLRALGCAGTSYEEVLRDYQKKKGIACSGKYDAATKGKVEKDLYDQRKAAKTAQLKTVAEKLKK